MSAVTDQVEVFACPTYFGGRFDRHLLPVEVLPDIAAYRDLIVEVAKHLYLSSAPRRLRVPKGFADSLQLGLAGIEEGSAGAVIKRIAIAGSLLVGAGFNFGDHFEKARDLVSSVVDAAANGQSIPSAFPPELLPRFNRIGRTLAPSEHMEFRSSPKVPGPKYTRELRKALILRAAEQYEDEMTISGSINGSVVDLGQLFVKTEEGLLELPVGQEVARQASPWLDRNVRIQAVVMRSRDDHIVKVITVGDLVFVEYEAATPLPKQFEELERLGNGWLDGDGQALELSGLREFRDTLVDAAEKYGLPIPFVYPTADNNARAEWSFPGWEVSASALLQNRTIELHAIDLAGDDAATAIFHIGRDAAIRLARWVATYVPQEQGQ